MRDPGAKGLSLATALMVSALSIYQLTINYALLILVFSACERRLRPGDEHAGAAPGKAATSDLTRIAIFSVASIAIYPPGRWRWRGRGSSDKGFTRGRFTAGV